MTSTNNGCDEDKAKGPGEGDQNIWPNCLVKFSFPLEVQKIGFNSVWMSPKPTSGEGGDGGDFDTCSFIDVLCCIVPAQLLVILAAHAQGKTNR